MANVLLPAGGPAAPADSRFPALDGVRALAAVAVVLTHVGFESGAGVSGPLRSVLSRLDVGVAIFFVLSGFLLHRPQAAAALSGARVPAAVPYLWRRALRVLPAYWLAVAAAMLVLPANSDASPADWARQLTLTQVYTAEGLRPGLTQTWSLATEVSFYLVLPLLGRLAGRTLHGQLRLCAAMYATGLGWQALVAHELLPPHTGYWLPAHADWFALGMALAATSAAGAGWLDELGREGVTCWLGAAALFVVAGTPVTGPYGLALLGASELLTRTVLYGGVAVLLLLPAVARDARGPVPLLLGSWPARALGRISYGVFLLHLTVLTVAADGLDVVPFSGHFWELLAIVLPVTVAVAWASLQLVEEPALRLRSWGPGRDRQEAATRRQAPAQGPARG